MRPDLEKVIRMDGLFKQLAKVGSAEIIDAQERRHQSYLDIIAKGNSSEQNVIDVLSAQPMVSRINRVDRYSPGDINGIDLVVSLRKDLPEVIVTKLRVQVKSSPAGREKFIRKIKAENCLQNGEVNDWLTRNGWIILNGQKTKEEIVESFLSQLTKINDFARTEVTTADGDDVNARIREQAKKYFDYLRKGTLTPEWRAWAKKHSLELAKLAY